MSNESVVHVLDRLTATPATAMEAAKLVFLLNNGTPWPTVMANGLLLIGALLCFGQSQVAQSRVDRDGFVFWHTLWHL